MMSGGDGELEIEALANGVGERPSSVVLEQRQTPVKRPQPEEPVETPSKRSSTKETTDGSGKAEKKAPEHACPEGESPAPSVCTPPRVAKDKPKGGSTEGEEARKAAVPPDTPGVGSSKPKFVFGSAAKQLVTFNALAGSESKADFSMIESNTEEGGEVLAGQQRRPGEARKKAKLEGKVEEKTFSEQSEDEYSNNQDDSQKETDGGVFGTGKSYTSTILLTETKVATGEENEITRFSARAKLFEFEGGEWRERGLGNVKVNVKEESARVIMRADGILRLLLNTRIFVGMSFEIVQEKSVRLVAFNAASGEAGSKSGKMGTFLLRFKSPDDAFDFSEAISAFT